jgi:hypothetical protein
LETTSTRCPRPPDAVAPKPSAPGKASCCDDAREPAVKQSTAKERIGAARQNIRYILVRRKNKEREALEA